MTTCCAKARKSLQHFDAFFEEELRSAQFELDCLQAQFNDACWYSFETACKQWQNPWLISDPDSMLYMHGLRHTSWWNKGKRRHKVEFVPYFVGMLKDAPLLPLEVVLVELRQAKAYVDECKERLNDAHDWAPGGAKYQQLARTTMVGQNSNQVSDNGL